MCVSVFLPCWFCQAGQLAHTKTQPGCVCLLLTAICVFDLFCNIDSWHMVRFKTPSVNTVLPFFNDMTSGLALGKHFYHKLKKKLFLNHIRDEVHVEQKPQGRQRQRGYVEVWIHKSIKLKVKPKNFSNLNWLTVAYFTSFASVCCFIRLLICSSNVFMWLFKAVGVDLRTGEKKKHVPHIHKEIPWGNSFWILSSIKY